MRSVNLQHFNKNGTAWVLATLLTNKYLNSEKKSNELYDQLPSNLQEEKKARIKSLFYGVLRNQLRITEAYSVLIRKSPKNLLKSILLITGFELLESGHSKKEKIIHHAVEASKELVSKQEVQFLNAVLRKLPEQLSQQKPDQSLSTFYSHPDWLVENWIKTYGKKETQSLLEWNQSIPSLYLYNRSMPKSFNKTLVPIGDHFYRINGSDLKDLSVQSMLNEGSAYIKDPATRHAIDALDPKPGEHILDLCSAPGGKSFDCIHRMDKEGLLVCVDLPGKRIERLEENLSPFKNGSVKLKILASDILSLTNHTFQKNKLPHSYDAVLIDAPCSNTGVIQRKPDVRWRLKETDIEQCSALQLKLLKAASAFVKKNGRIVYSTCSIEPSENNLLIEQFLNSEEGAQFKLETSNCYYPWIHQHDGAGVFLMKRK